MNREEQNELLITPVDIHLITGLDIEAAKKEHSYLRASLGYGSDQLLVSQYCDHHNLDTNEIIAFLYPFGNNDLN